MSQKSKSKKTTEVKGNYWEQLVFLKNLTKTTGVIHEAQLLNLKYWFATAFTPKLVKDFAVDVDKHEVTCHLNKQIPATKKMASMVATLDRGIHDLLGIEWKLIIMCKNKTLYKGSCEKVAKNGQTNRS